MQPLKEEHVVGGAADGLLWTEFVLSEEAERVYLAQYEFLAAFAHKLRTPLHAVLGWSETLLLKNQDKPELQRGLETLARSARAQAKLIEEVLDASGIVAGKIRLRLQLTNPFGLIEAAVAAIRPAAEAKNIDLRATLDPQAGPIMGDAQRLQQVLASLLSNAVKFTPAGGQVEVCLSLVFGNVQVSVRDSGIGLSSHAISGLFTHDSPPVSTTGRRRDGLGMSLRAAKKLVALHGGRVEALSAGEGQGATFVVSLPSARLREATDRDPPSGAHTLNPSCDSQRTATPRDSSREPPVSGSHCAVRRRR